MKKDKLGIWLCVSLLLLINVYAQMLPVEPIARTEQLIKLEHEDTRAWCKAQWDKQGEDLQEKFDEETKDLEDKVKTMMWFDRIASFITVFCGMFLAITLKEYLKMRRDKSMLLIDQQEADYEDNEDKEDKDKEDKKDMPEPPAPELPKLK